MTDVAAGARSYLYVPADRPDRLARATARGADALILDLEDAVPPAGKHRARGVLADWLAGQDDPGCELWVRINPGLAEADIAAVVTPWVTGVVVPKAEPALLAEIDRLLTAHERAVSAPVGRTGALPLIETARGLLSAAAVAAAPRVARLGIGEADLAADLGLQPGPGREELIPLRLQIVVASAAQGIGAPVGPASLDYKDRDGLRESTQSLLRLGFRARTAIHPAQVATVNDVFTPAPAEVARARRLVAAFEEAVRGGIGVTTDEEGRMVDVAVIRAAREVLARARSSPGQP
ncbi:MAG TPA: CoA ester lyase [Streptosporangiaceae bacterium]|nr:CoA ester lyase [Streptosporangiaceae bacterium]